MKDTKAQFLLDTDAGATIISLDTLAGMTKAVRTAFQNSSAILQVADGKSLHAKGPVLCNVTVGGLAVIDAVYAALILVKAI